MLFRSRMVLLVYVVLAVSKNCPFGRVIGDTVAPKFLNANVFGVPSPLSEQIRCGVCKQGTRFQAESACIAATNL